MPVVSFPSPLLFPSTKCSPSITDNSLFFVALKDSKVVEIIDENVLMREEPEK